MQTRTMNREGQEPVVFPNASFQPSLSHIAGAISLPLGRLGAEARNRLDASLPVVAYCYDSLCDMSGRAAARLEGLGFTDVYNYQPSKIDWFANSLPAEGTDTSKTRLADLADRDVPRCRPGETVADLRDRIGDWDICVVVDDQGVLLGLVRADALRLDAGRRVDDVMRESPLTHRPDLSAAEMAQALEKRPEPQVLVTNADGTLVGVADPEQVIRAAKDNGEAG